MAFLQPLRGALLAAICVLLAACSAGVSAPPATPTPGTINVTPDTATLYAELPTSFVITGGTGPYFVTSSNQAIVPVVGTVAGSAFTVVPAQVGAETQVTLTVRDSANSPPATASLTVRPRTITNVVTLTPSAGQPAACGTSICAGGDAELRTTLTLNGVPLTGRAVRFEVVSGDFRIIESGAGSGEILVTTSSVSTDSTGTARVRIRALNNAGAQTGLIQVTDVSSGFSQRVAIPIAPLIAGTLAARPAQIDFIGQSQNQCAGADVSATVIIAGGRPPYQVGSPPNFTIDNIQTTPTGGSFRVTPTGVCVTSQVIPIADSAGGAATVTLTNSLGVQATPVVASPAAVTLTSCRQRANVRVAGGTPPYYSSSGSDAILVEPEISVTGDFSIVRRQGTPGTTAALQAGFTDRRSTATVTVTLADQAATTSCP